MTRIRSTLPTLALFAALVSCGRSGPAGVDDGAPPFALSATSLSFPATVAEHTITMTNGGSAPIAWSAEGSSGWLVVTPESGTLAPGTTALAVRVQRTALGPGTYHGEVRVVAANVTVTVGVTAEVDARPVASLDATTIELGAGQASAQVRLTNSGNAPLAWSLSGPNWITIAPVSGTIAPGAAQAITLTPDRSTLTAGTQQADLALVSDGGAALLTVRVEVAAPALLRLTPSVIGFGTTGETATVAVANDGGLPLSWTASSDQAWLRAAPASGTVAPGVSQTIVLSGSRSGLAPGTHRATLHVTSNGGAAVVEATIEVPQSSAALAGQIVDQFSGASLGGLTIRFDNATVTTDAAGWFSVPGTPSGSLRSLTITGTGVHSRSTFARGTDTRWLAIPSSFDMSAFDDVARDYEPRTIRWLQSPNVYIDTRHVGPDPGLQLQTWISEARSNVERFVMEWSNGTVGATAVTVGSSPPPDGTTGWIVIRFDDDASHYSSPSTVGNARTGWNFQREVLYSTISLRFSLVSGPAYSSVRIAVLGHELGHGLGMGHMEGSTQSIMTPRISITGLSSFDARTGSIVYSRSPGNTSPDSDTEAFFVGGLAPAVVAGEHRWICDAPTP